MNQRRSYITNIGLCTAGMPAVLGFLCLYILPISITVWYSFLETSFSRKFVGLKNYAYILHNSYFRMAVMNTFILVIILVTTSLLTAFVVGYLLHKHKKTEQWASLLLLLPLLIPSASVSEIWRTAFNTSWYSGPLRSYAAITSLFLWKYAGFGAVFMNNSINKISVEIAHAAYLDGAGDVRVYCLISLPMCKKEIAFLAMLFLMFAFRIYKESYLLFGEYPCDAMYLIQHYLNNHFFKMNFQYVSSGATCFALFALLVYTIVYHSIQRRKESQ